MRLPKINQKVTLRIPEGPWAGTYSTYVEAVDSRVVSIAHPMYGGGLIPLTRGAEVSLEYVDGGERLAFATQVEGHLVQVVPILVLQRPLPTAIERRQQRDFVRLDVNLPLWHAVVPRSVPGQPAEEVERAKVFHRGRTIDISGSGALMQTSQSLAMGTPLHLVLYLQGAHIHIQAVAVRLAELKTPQEFWVGVRFTKVDERDRERIVRFIFNEQRTRRQRGLL